MFVIDLGQKTRGGKFELYSVRYAGDALNKTERVDWTVYWDLVLGFNGIGLSD